MNFVPKGLFKHCDFPLKWQADRCDRCDITKYFYIWGHGPWCRWLGSGDLQKKDEACEEKHNSNNRIS